MTSRLLILLLLMNFRALSISPDRGVLPPYRQYTLRDGLSQMQVTELFQDSRGYLWTGTKSGLNCFNGERFTSYKVSNGKLSDDYIYDITEDVSGRIWASTATSIVCLDGEKITAYAHGNFQSPKIAADHQGRIWYLATNQAEQKNHVGFIGDDGIVSLDHLLEHPRFATSRDITFSSASRQVLIALDSTLYGFTGENFRKIYDNSSYISFISSPSGNTYFMDEDYNTKFNLLMYRNGGVVPVARVEGDQYTSKPTLSETIYFTSPHIPNDPVRLTPDSVIRQPFHDLFTNLFLADRDGQVWVGSENGLHQIFDNGFTTYSREIFPQVWAVTEDRAGDLWFSSYLYGLSKTEKDSLRKFPHLRDLNAFDFYFRPSVDKQGRIYFPNAKGMLIVDGNHFRQYTDMTYLTTFYDEEKDLVWGGSRRKAVAFSPGHHAVRTISEKDSLDAGNFVIAINRDTTGHYWFGGGKGAARYNWDTGKLKNYRPGNRIAAVRTIRNDPMGTTWLGCDNGLFRYDTRRDSLIKMELAEFSEPVNLISAIDTTWLIVSQPYGIYLLDLKEYYLTGKTRIHLFNEINGFLGVEPGQDGAFTDSRGNIWMTTSTELVRLDPRELKTGNYSMNLRINKCNGKPLAFNTRTMALLPNQNSAVITFEAICFSRPNPVQYSWRLESDPEWSEWQEENYAVISGLSHGRSALMVRARIPGLPLTAPVEERMEIRVEMAIYRQAWFFPAIFAFLTFNGLFFFTLALLRMKKAHREAKIFQVHAIQSQMNPHFIFNVLAAAQSGILRSNIQKANDYLVQLSELMRGFLEASAGTGTIKSPRSGEGLVTLSGELKLLQDFVDLMQAINPGKFEYEVVTGPQVDPDRESIPPLLIQPFIENAIRHGLLPSPRKGFLKLSVSKSKEVLEVKIIDNGIGMEKSAFLNSKSPMRYNSRGKELTLNRIKLLNQLGFHIQVETTSDESGTTVKIKFHTL